MIKSSHSATRAMFYCHDTYGLGHLRRTLTLANHIRASVPELSQLIVTGSAIANRFSYPPDTDYIKLPCVTKAPGGQYEPRSLSTSLDTVVSMRRDMILNAAHHFKPDFFIVDHAPAGLMGEAVATLRYLKQNLPDTKIIVGLRDIMDEAQPVRTAWTRDGSYELFDDIYDLILVYGNQSFYDVVPEYGLSPRAAEKTRFVGYLGRKPSTRSPEDVRASLNMQTDKLVVVTAGGGGDGKNLYDAMIRDLLAQRAADFDCLIVGGPLLSESDSSQVRSRLGNRGNIHFLDFTDDLSSYLAAADAVVSMGGYNSVCEILSVNSPAIIVPRTTPRKEQLIRAKILSGRGLVDMIHPRDLTPAKLLTRTRNLLASAGTARPSLPMNGLNNTMNELALLLPTLWSPAAEMVTARADAVTVSPARISGR